MSFHNSRPQIFDEAYVTSVLPYGDTDCVVRLFTKEHGRLIAFMKAGLKTTKKRGGVCQAPSRCSVGFRRSPTSNMVKLGTMDVSPITLAISENLRSFGLAVYFLELIELFLPEEEPAPEIFELCEQTFECLKNRNQKPELLRAFELHLMQHGGFLPNLSEPNDETRDLLESDRQAAMVLLKSPLDKLPEFDKETHKSIGRLFQGTLHQVAKAPLKSIKFLKTLGG